ncbi:hypothetical protein [Micromonospora narathiwatensis]|uniref:hypothetical protein n=1 Tax=Micromonospora narathiwatensis TaxID=299146 RepID=UPI0012FDD6FD|nr:hypothetical protein [Micromonospora narathiwatensis]
MQAVQGKEMRYLGRGAPEMEPLTAPPLIDLVPLGDHQIDLVQEAAELGFGITKMVERVDDPQHAWPDGLVGTAGIENRAVVPATDGTPLQEVSGRRGQVAAPDVEADVVHPEQVGTDSAPQSRIAPGCSRRMGRAAVT